MNREFSNISIKEDKNMELPVMMYIHGFMSGANGAKQHQLQKLFKGRYRVIAPELDGDPDKSLTILNEVIEFEKPQIIVGTSLGAWMAMMCEGFPAIRVLVNPVTCPQEELARWLDTEQKYFCKRLDGVQSCRLTRKILDKYIKYDIRRPIAYHGEDFRFLCSNADELLGDRHICTLKPFFAPNQLKIVNDFGHQCRDAGMRHLHEILEKTIKDFEPKPFIPGEFRILSPEVRDAAMARGALLNELMDKYSSSQTDDHSQKF